jgi:hypothetical protein
MAEKKTAKEPTEEEVSAAKELRLIWQVRLMEQQAKEHRRKFDWEWLVRTLYVRGYHHARYQRSNNTVTFSTRTGVKIPVNLVSAHLRGVRNQVTSFQPKWEVLPNVTTDAAFQNAKYSGKVLDYAYEKAQIKRKIKEAVTHALMYSIGIWYFDIDAKGNIVINTIDPFDFYVDPNIKSPNLNDPEYGAEYVIITHQMPIDALKKNKRYQNTENLQTDNLVASAEYKQFLMQVTKNQFTAGRDVNQTVILKEAWIRERQEDGSIKMRILTYVDSIEKPLRNELTDEEEYPFEILQGDIYPGELYGEGWIKHLIPINRVIDALESHIFEYNHLFAKGRFIIDKNSGVRLIVNQHGQIIEKNRGSTVQPITVPPLPPSPQEQISNMRKYLEDISGVHDVSLGRLPGTIRSGVAIAELRQSDATNQSDLVDNLEDFLSRAGRKILKLVAENWTTSKLVSVTGIGGKPEYFMAIGERGSIKDKTEFKMGDRKLPLAVIGAENEVRVQVGSWLAYTKEARQEKLKELFRLGAIDQMTYLQHAEFADIEGIMERTREERIFQNNSGAKSASIQRDYGIQLDEESVALAENEIMTREGIEQHAEPGDEHELHLLIHKEERDNDLVQAHIAEHEDYIKWEGKMESRPLSADQNAAISPQDQEMMQVMGMGVEDMLGGIPPAEPAAPDFSNAVVGPGAPPFNPSQPVIREPRK